MSKRQTLDQQRAAKALMHVSSIEKQKNDDSLKRKYNSLARSTPAMVQSNGNHVERK